MKFFGRRYSSPVYEEAEEAPTPVGMPCGHCGEVIAPGDDGWLIPHFGTADCDPVVFHDACHMRSIVGSVAHQAGLCSCYVPGSVCGDDPSLTRREAAKAAADFFFKGNR